MASNDTVNCEVIHDGSTVTITSPKGGQVKCDIAKLRKADFGLYHKLTRQGPMHEAEISLTKGEMAGLLKVEGVKTDTNGAAKKVVPVVSEPVTTPPVQLSQEAKRAEMATVKRTEAGANQKVTGYGMTQEESKIARAENAVKNLEGAKGDFYEFKYDIPSAKKDEDGNPDWDTTVPNPSWQLWRMGMCRDMLSKWFAPVHVLNSPMFKNLITQWDEFNAKKDPSQKPVKYGILRYHPDEAEKIREIAREHLREQIIEVHTSMLERLDAASRRYEAADGELNRQLLEEGKEVTPAQYERILKLRTISESGAISSAKQHCDACIAAARSFDETGAVVDLIKALHAAIKFNKSAIKARNELSEV